MTENSTLLATFGDAMLDGGFTAVPNTILFYKNRLGLTVRELYLIIMVLAFHGRNKDVIRDKELDVGGRSFIRQRRSLEEKGYLKCEVVHSSKNNRPVTLGVRYDFSGLRGKIEEFVKHDKELENLPAPVYTESWQPALPGFDTVTKNKNGEYEHKKKEGNAPSKKVNENTNEKIETENSDKEFVSFLSEYNILHKETVGIKINYSKQKKYLQYLSDIYKSIKQNEKDYKAVIQTSREIFLAMPIKKRNTYKLQDTLRLAITKQSEKENRKNNIPSGVNTLMDIIKRIDGGQNAKEAYSAYGI